MKSIIRLLLPYYIIQRKTIQEEITVKSKQFVSSNATIFYKNANKKVTYFAKMYTKNEKRGK